MKNLLITVLLVIVSATLFAADGPYVPTELERARWTTSDMSSLRLALAAYHSDHGSFPEAATIEDVRKAIEPMYILHAPTHDAWGRDFHYELIGKEGFRLVSAGADGKFQRDGWSQTGTTADPNVDAVATAEGRWLQLSWKLR